MIFKNLYTNNISNIKKLNHWTEQLNDNGTMTLLQVTSWIMFYCQRKLWILQTGFANVPLLLNMRLDNLFEVSNYFENCENIWKDIINNPWNTYILLPSLDHLFTKFFSCSHFRSSPLFAFITSFWSIQQASKTNLMNTHVHFQI